MNKIAIFRCLHSNDVCAGAACLRAFNSKSASFAQYGEEPLELVAYFSCDGCGDTAFNCEKGMAGKIATVKKLSPDALHVGVCTKHRDADGNMVLCSKAKNIIDEFEASGIKIVYGTH